MAKARKRRSKAGKIIFVIEIVVLVLLIGALAAYSFVNSKLNKIENDTLDMNKVQINNAVESNTTLTGYTNLALFGLDSRPEGSQFADNQNSDTIMIASINNDTKEVKLVSLYRDTLLDIGDDTYQKCNAAYATGGPEAAISMLNTNLDLNITDYATVDFSALVTVIDELGGLDIPLSYNEIEHMNNYCVETSEATGKSYTPIEKPEVKPEGTKADTEIVGTYHLNGVQATSYCRIRYTAGLDFKRTERQRLVLQMIADKAKKSSLTTLSSIMDKIFPMVQTSLTQQEIFNMGAGMLSYKFDDTSGFPFEHTEMNHTSKGDIVVPNTLEKNVTKLHEFLFGEKNYQVSEDVKKRSETISGIAGGTVTETSDSVTATSEDSYSSEPVTDYTSDYSTDYSGYDSSYDSGYSDYDGEDYDSGYSDYDSGDTNYDSGYTDNGGGDTGDYEGSGDTGGIEESSSEEME
ncbi:Regulatory protein msrR [Blautia hydrogenotrophica]|uniref:LCP family protein n=1 Tax=Blautia hydrogenotrophica TaxID=53443 RepID=UPI0006C08BE7|nr:LCP family protein [Blautia hydrogenotrophica]CUN10368.1 Regulatory protein msrR [Blautia hydrogenotrophica]SCH71892.1 Regulatory protein msrR [uncultured Blautia sp.]